MGKKIELGERANTMQATTVSSDASHDRKGVVSQETTTSAAQGTRRGTWRPGHLLPALVLPFEAVSWELCGVVRPSPRTPPV